MTDTAATILTVWSAEVFATAAHHAIGQRRKYTNEPYIDHPARVVELVKSVEGHTWDMVCAAWLHDVLEDTQVTVDVMDRYFGPSVVEMVWLLTDVDHTFGNRATRKALDRERLAGAPGAVQTIKVADLIDNTSTIVRYDREFAKVYVREKRALLEVLQDADTGLWGSAHGLLYAAEAELGL